MMHISLHIIQIPLQHQDHHQPPQHPEDQHQPPIKLLRHLGHLRQQKVVTFWNFNLVLHYPTKLIRD